MIPAIQISPGGNLLAKSFKDAAASGDFNTAFASLQGLCMWDALVACLDLFDDDQATYKALQASTTSRERPQFSVQ